MIRDRGTKKWQGMFLPEHRERLQQLWDEQDKIDKPVLDEQQIELINQNLMAALAHRSLVRCNVYEDGYIKTYEGYIRRVDNQKIELSGSEGYYRIRYDNLISVLLED